MDQVENTTRTISAAEQSAYEAFKTLSKVANELIIGQPRLMDRLLIALLSNGHLLVEGAPGLAKTTAIKVIADRIEGDFHSIQLTPDLLPADLTGTEIYRPQEGSFEFQQGPIFHNLILADEVNRAPAKVQSALLEAMGEHQVTVGSVTYRLPKLFLVMATQNPIEQEGTYSLPEAQVDRFMFKVKVTYPSLDEELLVMQRMANTADIKVLEPVLSLPELMEMRESMEKVFIDEKVERYIIRIVDSISQRFISPRGKGLELAAKLLYRAS